jgi:hypothetical protein
MTPAVCTGCLRSLVAALPGWQACNGAAALGPRGLDGLRASVRRSTGGEWFAVVVNAADRPVVILPGLATQEQAQEHVLAARGILAERAGN